MAQKLNTKPASGTRDFLPADLRRREHVLGVIREVYGRYGFEPLETPTMERLDTLLGKYGEEGDQLIFRVLERGAEFGRAVDKTVALAKEGGEPRAFYKTAERFMADLALRYDLTVPLARVMCEYQAVLPRFFKRYQIQPVWRADRPAKGRFREFYQCDVDVVGSKSLTCEVEVTSAISDVLEKLGFADFVIRLNHREILRGMIESSGIPLDLETHAITALDKLDKIGVDGVGKELVERGISEESAIRLLAYNYVLAEHDNQKELDRVEGLIASSETGLRGVRELRQLLAIAENAPSGPRLRVDVSLARGLSYYTGPIFEVQVKDLAGSLGGGGRYDKLLGMFSGKDVPAVGVSLGLERILVVMEERRMFRDVREPSNLVVFRIDEETTNETMAFLSRARDFVSRIPEKKIFVDLYPDVDKFGKQFQYAEARNATWVAFIGSKERDERTITIKRLSTPPIQISVPEAKVYQFMLETL